MYIQMYNVNVSSVMGVDLYTSAFKNIIDFDLKNGGQIIHELTYI